MGRKPLGGGEYELLKDYCEGRKERMERAKEQARLLIEGAEAAEHKGLLGAIRRAKEAGLSDYAIRTVVKVSPYDRFVALVAEACGADYKAPKGDWFDGDWLEIRGWRMRRKKQEGRIDVEGKPARVVEVIDPEGGVWEANVCHWGFNHGWNWWIDPTGHRISSNTYRTEHIPAAVRYIAFGEKWLDEVEEDKR